jgi:2-methylcitrate dehydratase PrpD
MTALDTPAERLGHFVADLALDDVPDDGVHTAERCFLDTVGVMIAGSEADAGSLAAETMADLQGTGGPATVVGHGTESAVLDAAFVNATAGHSLDFDDTVSEIHAHPSVPLVSTILAAGEAADADGREALEAYVAGFETDYHVAKPFIAGHYERGWHATSTIGVFGATAAAASLWSLSPTETTNALDMAASFASGLKKNFGSTAKPVHPAHAARSGLTAAALARNGATATDAALGDDRGFYDLYGEGTTYDPGSVPAPGERWAIVETGVDVKKYPCCLFTHAPIAAVERLAVEHGFGPDDVESIDVSASSVARETVAYDDPESGLQGKFSMQYTVASALTRDRVGIDTFADDAVDHEPTRELMDRVTFSVDESVRPGWHGATVTVDLRSGETLTATRDEPPGTPAEPLSEAELREKFRHCANRLYEDERVEVLADRLRSLRSQTDIEAVVPD